MPTGKGTKGLVIMASGVPRQDTEAPLDAVHSARASLAVRVGTPWWYHPVLGPLLGGLVAVQAVPSVLLQTAYRGRLPARHHSPRPSTVARRCSYGLGIMKEQKRRLGLTDFTWRDFGWGALLGGLILLGVALVLDAPTVSVVLSCLIAVGGAAAVIYDRASRRSR